MAVKVKKVGVKKSNVKKAVGLGILAAAAVAAGVYFYGKNGKQHRAQVAKLANKAKAEVVSKLKTAKKVNKAIYNKVVSSVMSKYSALKDMDKSEFGAIVSDLRRHWKNIERELKKEVKKSQPAKTKSSKKRS
ncbi:MAG: hypothetical protein AAB787_02100 [Patescibacteria group bacterium]